MANHKSAEKAARKAVARTLRNRAWKSMVKTSVRKVREAVAVGDADQAQAALKRAFRLIDKAATKGVIHRNTAARKKARLSRALQHQTA